MAADLKAALKTLMERGPDFLLNLFSSLDGELLERLLARPGAAERLVKAVASRPEALRSLIGCRH